MVMDPQPQFEEVKGEEETKGEEVNTVTPTVAAKEVVIKPKETKPVEKANDKPTEKIEEKPTKKAADKVVEKPAEKLVEKPVERVLTKHQQEKYQKAAERQVQITNTINEERKELEKESALTKDEGRGVAEVFAGEKFNELPVNDKLKQMLRENNFEELTNI